MLEHFTQQLFNFLHFVFLPPILLDKLFSKIGDLFYGIECGLVLELLHTRGRLVERIEGALLDSAKSRCG